MSTVKLKPEIIGFIDDVEPSSSTEKSILKLLESDVVKKLTKYSLMTERFEKKYVKGFKDFEKHIKKDEPGFEEEQDYYDWDMALTAIEDLTPKLKKIRSYLEKR